MLTRVSGTIIGLFRRAVEFLLAHAAFAVSIPAVLVHGKYRVARRNGAYKKR